MGKKIKKKNEPENSSPGWQSDIQEKPKEEPKEKHVRFDKLDLWILLIIVLISLGTRLYGITYPRSVYFDETHYVPAARDYLDPKAIDRNDIHPPVAKEIMAVFMWIYGDGPFGWRIGSVVFGILMIIFMYLFGLAMFENRFGAIMSACLLSVEFLQLAQSRIATLDIYIAFFIMVGYYFAYLYIKEEPSIGRRKGNKRRSYRYLVLSAVFFGLAFSVKLSALGGVAGAALFVVYALWKEKKKFPWEIFTVAGIFCVVMLGVFLLTHVPLFMKGAKIDRLFYNRTFSFHYKEKFTHPYLSQIWQWPIVHRPIWYEFTKNPQTQMIRGIVAIGSLLFWWSFIPVLLDMIYRAFREKDNRVIFILSGYIPLYLFWLSSFSFYNGFHFKGGFFYYMLPCVPFMVLALTETLNDLRDSRIGLTSIIIYCVGLVAFLIFFFPVLVGIPITEQHYNYIMKLNIFKNWI